jgi:Patatin-like phospholipase
LLTFLSSGQSYAEIPGLEHDLDAALDTETLKRIADGGSTGRLLAVNTTNVDMQEMHAWDVTAEAKRGVETNDPTRVRQILLASSAIPAAFPSRMIDGELYVDGGITANIIYGGRAKGDDGFIAQWIEKYPNVPIPKVRYWVIFNNKERWTPQTVQPKWTSILGATTTAGTRSATVNSMRLLFAMAEVARLRHHADVQVHIVSVPDAWEPPNAKTFDKDTMNALADLGEKMGADPSTWQTEPPG